MYWSNPVFCQWNIEGIHSLALTIGQRRTSEQRDEGEGSGQQGHADVRWLAGWCDQDTCLQTIFPISLFNIVIFILLFDPEESEKDQWCGCILYLALFQCQTHGSQDGWGILLVCVLSQPFIQHQSASAVWACQHTRVWETQPAEAEEGNASEQRRAPLMLPEGEWRCTNTTMGSQRKGNLPRWNPIPEACHQQMHFFLRSKKKSAK